MPQSSTTEIAGDSVQDARSTNSSLPSRPIQRPSQISVHQPTTVEDGTISIGLEHDNHNLSVDDLSVTAPFKSFQYYCALCPCPIAYASVTLSCGHKYHNQCLREDFYVGVAAADRSGGLYICEVCKAPSTEVWLSNADDPTTITRSELPGWLNCSEPDIIDKETSKGNVASDVHTRVQVPPNHISAHPPCLICKEMEFPGMELITLNCGHEFCAPCIVEYCFRLISMHGFGSKYQCAICQKDLKSIQTSVAIRDWLTTQEQEQEGQRRYYSGRSVIHPLPPRSATYGTVRPSSRSSRNSRTSPLTHRNGRSLDKGSREATTLSSVNRSNSPATQSTIRVNPAPRSASQPPTLRSTGAIQSSYIPNRLAPSASTRGSPPTRTTSPLRQALVGITTTSQLPFAMQNHFSAPTRSSSPQSQNTQQNPFAIPIRPSTSNSQTTQPPLASTIASTESTNTT